MRESIENSITSESIESSNEHIMLCLHSEIFDSADVIKGSKGLHFVDMDALPENLEEGFVGEYRENLWAYIISPLDVYDKFSMKYAECTGVVVVGKDNQTGENISFLSHQNPNFFLWYDDLNFFDELKNKIQEIKDRCEPGSIDAVMFGGKFANIKGLREDHPINKIDKDMYIASVKKVSDIVKDTLNQDLEIISGPKFNPVYDNVIFINKERRLHLLRNSDNPEFIKNFNSRDVEKLSKDWSPGQWESSIFKKKKNDNL